MDHPMSQEGDYKDSSFYSQLRLPRILSSHITSRMAGVNSEAAICMSSCQEGEDRGQLCVF